MRELEYSVTSHAKRMKNLFEELDALDSYLPSESGLTSEIEDLRRANRTLQNDKMWCEQRLGEL